MKSLINKEFPQKKNVSIAIERAVWVDVTREFVYRAHIYCVFADILNEEQRKIHDLQITIDAVSKSLDDGNNDYYCGPDKPIETAKEEKKEGKGKGKGKGGKALKRKYNKELDVTPKKSEKKVKFVKVSPKSVQLLDKFKCTECDREFVFLKSLKRHFKDHHGGNVLPDNLKEKMDLVTCKICGKKQKRDQIQRHLKLAHKMEKKDEDGKKMTFRGWLTFDNTQWRPLWLDSHLDDPEEEVTVPVEGKIVHLYGVDYKVEEVNIVEETDDIEDKPETKEIETSKDSQQDLNAWDSCQFPYNEMRDPASEASNNNYEIPDEFFEEPVPGPSNEGSHKRNLFGSAVPDPMDDIIDSNSNVDKSGADGLKEQVGQQSSFNESEEMHVQEEQFATKSETLKLKVYKDKAKNLDFWEMEKDSSLEIDSDYESDDSESFTENRVRMKKLRYNHFSYWIIL